MGIDKEFKLIKDQINILKNRNVIINDETKAKRFLLFHNYFDVINAFENLFLDKNCIKKQYIKMHFEDFVECYQFDNKLKIALLELVFEIEETLRTQIAYYFAEKYCYDISHTVEYTNKLNFNIPNNVDLLNKFNEFLLFRQNKYDKQGVLRKKCYIDWAKDEYDYISEYNNPPIWILIKTLPFGSLYYFYVFLTNDLQEKIKNNIAGNSISVDAFTQALEIIKNLRNNCAHLEMITKIRINTQKLNKNSIDIKTFLDINKKNLSIIDILKILKLFGNINGIKSTIYKFYFKMLFKRRMHISKKILGYIGGQKLKHWLSV